MMDISLKCSNKKVFSKITDIILLVIVDVLSLCYVLYLNQSNSPGTVNYLEIILLMAICALVVSAASGAIKFETVAEMFGCHTPKEDLTFFKRTLIVVIAALIDTAIVMSVLFLQFNIMGWLYRL